MQGTMQETNSALISTYVQGQPETFVVLKSDLENIFTPSPTILWILDKKIDLQWAILQHYKIVPKWVSSIV